MAACGRPGGKGANAFMPTVTAAPFVPTVATRRRSDADFARNPGYAYPMQAGHDVTPPHGALCAEHPEVPAEVLCSRCGSFACNACTASEPPRPLCAQCVDAPAELADPAARLAAHLIDTALLLGPLALAAAFDVLARNDALQSLRFGLAGLSACATTGLSLHWMHRDGQSIGKRLLGLQVLQSDGTRASLGQLVWRRNVLPALLTLVPGLGQLFAIANPLFALGPERQCLHDRLADTLVVKKRDL